MRRLLRFLHEYLPDAVLVLLAIAIFATVRSAFRWSANTGSSVATLEDVVSIAGSLTGTVLAVLGALAAYRRFLKGRVFTTRAKIDLRSHPVRWLEPEGDLPRRLLHAVDIDVENVGDRTLWEPMIRLQATTLDDAPCELQLSTDGVKSKLKLGGVHGIEPGESVAYHYRFAIPEDVPVFKINGELVLDNSHAWHRARTVANTMDAGGPTH